MTSRTLEETRNYFYYRLSYSHNVDGFDVPIALVLMLGNITCETSRH
jgi:hypothetical protein